MGVSKQVFGGFEVLDGLKGEFGMGVSETEDFGGNFLACIAFSKGMRGEEVLFNCGFEVLVDWGDC